MSRSSCCCSVALWLLPSCATTPPLLHLPDHAPKAHYLAAPFAATDAPAAGGRILRVELLALRTPPLGRSVELAALAITTDRGSPFQGASGLPAGTVWLDATATADWLAQHALDDRGKSQQLGRTDAVVATGRVAAVTWDLPELPELRFESHADGTHARLVLGPKPTAQAVDLEGEPTAGEQHLLLEAAWPADGACLLFLPTRDARFAGYAVVMTDGGAAPDAALTAAMAAGAPSPTKPTSAAQRQWQLAQGAIGEQNRRRALLGIAQQLGCPRCIDLLVSADEPSLVAIGTAAAHVDAMATDYAWQFERALWSALLPGLQRDELAPAVQACLLRHFGALATDVTVLDLHLQGSADEAAFSAALREENLLALDDRTAAGRVHAHDWLLQHGIEVPGYQPLEPRESRRTAVRRFQALAAATAAAAANAAAASTQEANR